MANKVIIVAVLIAGLFCLAQATQGIDLYAATSVDGFKCLGSNGFSYVIVRIGRSTGHPDSNAVQNIQNALTAGMNSVDGYIFPCFNCGDPAGQVTNAIQNLQNGSASVNNVWLDIEAPNMWSSDTGANLNFITTMAQTVQSMGVNLGFYTSRSQWDPITGGASNFGNSPLWYAHYDNNPTFSDFVPFGGWSQPTIKQFAGDQTVCGIDTDLNYSQ